MLLLKGSVNSIDFFFIFNVLMSCPYPRILCFATYRCCLTSESCEELERSTGVSEGEVISWLRSLLEASTVSMVTKQYALLSLAKLSTRFTIGIQVLYITVLINWGCKNKWINYKMIAKFCTFVRN